MQSEDELSLIPVMAESKMYESPEGHKIPIIVELPPANTPEFEIKVCVGKF